MPYATALTYQQVLLPAHGWLYTYAEKSVPFALLMRDFLSSFPQANKLFFTVARKEAGEYWPRLQKSKTKVSTRVLVHSVGPHSTHFQTNCVTSGGLGGL